MSLRRPNALIVKIYGPLATDQGRQQPPWGTSPPLQMQGMTHLPATADGQAHWGPQPPVPGRRPLPPAPTALQPASSQLAARMLQTLIESTSFFGEGVVKCRVQFDRHQQTVITILFKPKLTDAEALLERVHQLFLSLHHMGGLFPFGNGGQIIASYDVDRTSASNLA